jgi:transporter family-2 protein
VSYCIVAITLQGQFMGLLDRSLGTRESVFLTYASGGALATLMFLATGGGNLRSWSKVPLYAYTAGLLGLIIVGSIGYVVSRLGTAKAFTLIVASQLLLAAVIEHFGFFAADLRPVHLTKVTGLCLLLAGGVAGRRIAVLSETWMTSLRSRLVPTPDRPRGPNRGRGAADLGSKPTVLLLVRAGPKADS